MSPGFEQRDDQICEIIAFAGRAEVRANADPATVFIPFPISTQNQERAGFREAGNLVVQDGELIISIARRRSDLAVEATLEVLSGDASTSVRLAITETRATGRTAWNDGSEITGIRLIVHPP